MPDATSPIGIFDSGVGGLAVLVELQRLLPGEDLVYFADTAWFPYGPRPSGEIAARAEDVARELIGRGAKTIVVACNTATSAAVARLRETFDIPFVSIEPALKPAAERTMAGKVALLVTPGTAQGAKLAALIDRFGSEVAVQVVAAPGLAERVEAGEVDAPETRALIREYLRDPLERGVDVVVLGCTHYAFLRELVEQEAGPGVAVIEPSLAVARQAARVLAQSHMRNPRHEGGSIEYIVSGDREAFERVRDRLLASFTYAAPAGGAL